jgi:hypothetical protein
MVSFNTIVPLLHLGQRPMLCRTFPVSVGAPVSLLWVVLGEGSWFAEGHSSVWFCYGFSGSHNF